MSMDILVLSLAIAAAGYFIGEGIRKSRHPDSKSTLDGMLEDDGTPRFIKAHNVHHVLGVSKEDAKTLIQEYPDIPHVTLNGNVYYPKQKLLEWMENNHF